MGRISSVTKTSPLNSGLQELQNESIGCSNFTCFGVSKSTNLKETRATKSYHVFSDFKTDFLTAFHWCIRYGMRLATIESAGEHANFLKEFRKHNKRGK